MTVFRITAPDGTVYKVTGPEGSTEAQALEQVKAQHGQAPTAAPVAVQAGSALREIPRQLGLTARYGAEGLASIAEPFVEPVRQLAVNPMLRAAGLPEARSLSGAVSGAADAIGLPSPANADERVIGDATRMMAASAGFGGLAGKGAEMATGGAKNVLNALVANQGTQAVGAAGAGIAGGSVREAGGGPVEQFVAALAGGVGAGVGAQGALRGFDKAVTKFTPKQLVEQRADKEITLILDRAGIDWSQVPKNIKTSVREEVAAALNTGQQLNPDALRRLLVFKRAEATPTVGMLTQDPGQITREANLSKTGANSTDVALHKLPGLQNANTASFLRQLDEAGAATAPDALSVGRGAIADLSSNVKSAKATNAQLYKQARDSAGRSVELDGQAAAQQAARQLQADGVGKLPKEVDDWLNNLTTGKDKLTVDYQQQLVKNLYRKMRGTQDGDLRHGLGIIRDALDNAEPVQVNPGNLPAAPGLPSGGAAIDAYRAARTAHRELMQRIEANPAMAAVVDGVEPDQFIRRFVISNSEDASVANVKRVADELSPQAKESMRQYLARHLKDAATNGTDDINKFSNAAFRKALRDIGDEKLSIFFTKEQLQKFHDIGDAAKYMQAQPSGSAVNNSNSGALLLGRGYDLLDSLANKAPLGLRDVIKGTVQGSQQKLVMAPRNALTLAADKQGYPTLPVNPLVALSAPVEARENNRRK